MIASAKRRLEKAEQVQTQRQAAQGQRSVQGWFHALTDAQSLDTIRTLYQSDPRFVDAPAELGRLFQRENRSELFHRLHDDLYPEGKPR